MKTTEKIIIATMLVSSGAIVGIYGWATTKSLKIYAEAEKFRAEKTDLLYQQASERAEKLQAEWDRKFGSDKS